MVTGLLDLLDQLDARHVELRLVAGTGPGPLLQTDSPRGAITGDVAAALTEHRDMVVAVLLGRMTGHTPGPCTVCGEISMVAILQPNGKPRNIWPTCRFSSLCTRPGESSGRHVPRPADVARTAAIAPPAQAKPPPKAPKQRRLGARPSWPT